MGSAMLVKEKFEENIRLNNSVKEQAYLKKRRGKMSSTTVRNSNCLRRPPSVSDIRLVSNHETMAVAGKSSINQRLLR